MTATESRLVATTRSEFGKGAARRTRRDGQVPSVIYGHGMEPLHVSLPGHATMMALKSRNAVLEIVVGDHTHTTLAKHIQRHPVRGTIEHVDLIVVTRDERVQVEIPVTTHGTGMADAVVTVEQPTIVVEAPATRLPDGVDVDVTGFPPGRQVLARDLDLPAEVTLVVDPATVVINASAVRGSQGAGDAEDADTEE